MRSGIAERPRLSSSKRGSAARVGDIDLASRKWLRWRPRHAVQGSSAPRPTGRRRVRRRPRRCAMPGHSCAAGHYLEPRETPPSLLADDPAWSLSNSSPRNPTPASPTDKDRPVDERPGNALQQPHRRRGQVGQQRVRQVLGVGLGHVSSPYRSPPVRYPSQPSRSPPRSLARTHIGFKARRRLACQKPDRICNTAQERPLQLFRVVASGSRGIMLRL